MEDQKEFLIDAGPLVAAIKTLKPFISDDDARPYLGGVFFELEEESQIINLVATDGAKLCVLNLPVDRQELFFNGALSAIIPEKALDTILAMLKGVQAGCPIALRFTGTHLFIDTPDEKGEFKCIDQHFPKYREVIPSKKPKFVIGLAKAQAQEAMKALSTQVGGERWEMTDEYSPLVIRAENKLVVVMPMRVTIPGELSAAPAENSTQRDIEDRS